MKDKASELLPSDFSELAQWIQSTCRRKSITDLIMLDNKQAEDSISYSLFTKDYKYHITARVPKIEKLGKGEMLTVNGYLGCTFTTRKPRAGEQWNRGRDLLDGDYSENTWRGIVNDILENELVKIVRTDK